MRFIFDGQPTDFESSDSVAIAVLRTGQHPAHGGTLCLSGDCGNCLGTIDGVSYRRTCQTLAAPGMVVDRHPEVGAPSMMGNSFDSTVHVIRRHTTTVIVGAGESGRAAAATHPEAEVFDANLGSEVVSISAGPLVVVRTPNGIEQVHADHVIVATGSAELHPVCDGNLLRGIFTVGGATAAAAAGVALGRVVTVGQVESSALSAIASVTGSQRADGSLIRIEGVDGRVTAVVTQTGDGTVTRHECDTVVVGLGSAPRDVLSRSNSDPAVTVMGSAGDAHELPTCPTAGVVCPCSKTTVEDLIGVWERGFREVELIKRSSLAGTGTCQGAACLPHVMAFVADRTGADVTAFTARPSAKQITMGEAAAGVHLDAWKRTALHHEHLALGANMDRFGTWWRPWNYGDHIAEYWAVREAVSIGDVSTLGKMIVTGPDSVEFLERLYPTTVADVKPGRSRYVLLLNERGHLIDDGMIVRETDTRFVLTFTSGGATNAEMWMRDWAETWNLDVRIMDRTQALGAINVTGPLGAELLRRVGVAEPPKFLTHAHLDVAGVPCHVMRLSFTGEASWELHHPVSDSVRLWRALMDEGRELGIKPHGLQALFGLRLEKGHVIVGMDTELDTTPRRIDHDWAVKMNKPFFLGREALERTAALVDRRRLFAWTMPSPAPVEGTPIMIDGQIHGHVTTSFTSPLLGHAVMLGWLKQGEFPDTVTIDGRTATKAETPFYDPESRRARA
jgi:glycine cleavage system aminomethyltransferase T